MRAALMALAVLLPTAMASPTAAIVAAGEAHGNVCDASFVMVVEVDAVAGSGALRGTAMDPVACTTPYMVWPPGQCAVEPTGHVRCEQYFPVTAGGLTTLYFRQWLNMTLGADGTFRFTSEHEQSPGLNRVFEGVLTRVDA